ncbi:MAG: CDP-diacylglycerol--glycerol-3-phosphate 3-phosphatidyltransferase, partial [Glaciimonas sp.]|nr:CDP-diacylglycerol--glycerol-3-phosphate 3-phosphatidyltransferase [Glaciimonas sp.]
ALREWMAQIGASKSVAVSSLGKIKTAAQMTAIPMLLYYDTLLGFNLKWLGQALMLLATVLTVWSMFYYLRKAWPLMKEKSH